MKLNRILLVVIVLALALQVSGCAKFWSANFILEINTADWNQVEFFAPGTCVFEPEGLRINGYWVEAPYEFRGDFSVVFTFMLDTDATRRINHLRMNMSDGNNGSRFNMIEIYILNIGDPDLEEARILIEGADVQHTVSTIKPDLNRTGINIFTITKTGNNIKMNLNFDDIADFYTDDYPPAFSIDYFIPAMYAHTDKGGLVHFVSTIVKYDGTKISHIY